MKRTMSVTWACVAGLLLTVGRPWAARAGGPETQPAEKPAGGTPAVSLNFDLPDTDVEMKPTEYGVRFTPGMAKAIASQMSRQMRGHYELDDEQTTRAQKIITRNLMKLAHDTQKGGRDSFELLMESMIANDGTFSKEDAQRWAKMTRPVAAQVKGFMLTTAGQIGRTMTLTQRLKLTGEMAAFAAGFATFEERLKRWEKGDVGEFSNPFFDSPSGATSAPASPPPTEQEREVRRARERAERRVGWELNIEERWTSYVDSAIEFYHLNEAQTTAARSILKESLERAKQIKSADYLEKMRRNREAAQMANRLSSAARNGPWMWQLDREYEDMLRPLQDVGREMRNRIDGLADTPQQQRAKEKIRDELAKSGYEAPPM